MDESTKRNIDRMSQALEKGIQDASRKFAEISVKENPKLVAQYFAGRGGSLSALVDYAQRISLGNANIDRNLTGEWIVLELIELQRARLRKKEDNGNGHR